MIAGLVVVVGLTACASDDKPSTARDFAVRACGEVRQSVAADKLVPNTVYRHLDRAIADAERAATRATRFETLATSIRRFRTALEAPATYTDQARFVAAARATKVECRATVNVDIGVYP